MSTTTIPMHFSRRTNIVTLSTKKKKKLQKFEMPKFYMENPILSPTDKASYKISHQFYNNRRSITRAKQILTSEINLQLWNTKQTCFRRESQELGGSMWIPTGEKWKMKKWKYKNKFSSWRGYRLARIIIGRSKELLLLILLEN